MISAIIGLPGSGKSLLLGYFADRALKGKDINFPCVNFTHFSKYKRVYTNFPFPGAYRLDFDSLGYADYHDCLILCDEIQLFADSRNFKNFGDNLKFFFSLHRKFGIDFIYASQSYDSMDKRIRSLTDRLFYLDSSHFGFMRLRQILAFFDVSDGQIKEGYSYNSPITNVYLYQKKLYGLIDTNAVLCSSIHLPEPLDSWTTAIFSFDFTCHILFDSFHYYPTFTYVLAPV